MREDNENLSAGKMEQSYCLETKSPIFQAALRDCTRVADSDASVMLLGESGTGKDVAAQYIHAHSRRVGRPFVAINCSAYPDSLLESELFGYEQGAFTGAQRTRQGRFEQSDTGTLFVDEIGDVSLSTQVKLLRAIETKRIEHIGADQSIAVDFRLISATNKDPHREVAEGRMREDFLYRVSTVVIRLPALRERPEDLEVLIHYFLNQAQRTYGRSIHEIKPKVWEFLVSYQYPGNIRELKNIIDRMVVLSEDGVITEQGLPVLYGIRHNERSSAYSEGPKTILPWRVFKAKSEAEYLRWVLARTGHNVAEASRLLGLSTRQLFNKIVEYDLQRD